MTSRLPVTGQNRGRDCENIAGQSVPGVGPSFVRFVARAVAADIDVDEEMIAPEFVGVSQLGPPRSVAGPTVQQQEWPSPASHVVGDRDTVVPDLRHMASPADARLGDTLTAAQGESLGVPECSGMWPES